MSLTQDNPVESRTTPGDAQCILLAGADARAFAQAQFAGDVRTVQAGEWQWNAWLDAKGAVRALMHLADLGDGSLFALLRGGDAQSSCSSLQRFVLRAKVSLAVSNGWHCHAGAGLPLGTIRNEAGAIGFGYGDRSLWLQRNDIPADASGEEALRLAAIRNGWPTLPPGEEHVFLPPALGLEHLGAVSFGKGCYPGQEIAARLHYRGGHKLRLTHLLSDALPIAGQPLSAAQPRAIVLDAVTARRGCESLVVLEESAQAGPGFEIIQRFAA